MTVAVAVPAAEAATEATKQEDDEDNDEYESERHGLTLLPVVEASLLLRSLETVVNIAHIPKELRNKESRPGTFIGATDLAQTRADFR